MFLDRHHLPSAEQRELLKGNSLEYLYHMPATEAPVTLPLLGSALRGIGNGWDVVFFTTEQNHKAFFDFQQTLQHPEKVTIEALADTSNNTIPNAKLILIDGSKPGIQIKRLRDKLNGKAHIMVAGSDIAHKDYDLISDITRDQYMPKGVLAITGTGKGKTTIGLGIAASEMSKGGHAAVIQWFKKREWNVSEHAFSDMLKNPEQLPFFVEGQGFYGYSPLESEHDVEKHIEAARNGLAVAKQLLRSGRYSVLVFDELVDTVQAISQNIPRDVLYLDEIRELLSMTQDFPQTKVVVTGRRVTDDWADLIQESVTLTNTRHPFDQGKFAQRGLDY